MNKTTDVIVAGSGLAGLTAALAAVSRGCGVRIISEGMGCLAIGPGCIDLLGYGMAGGPLENPWDGLDALPPEHPYTLLGRENIRDALAALGKCLEAGGLPMRFATDGNGAPRNILMPTIMGTLKPTYLVPAEVDARLLDSAKKILVLSVRGFRDCRPKLIISQLRRYRAWADREFEPLVLPAPFEEHGRSLNALDLAHVADRPEGGNWLLNTLRGLGRKYDLALIPPMLGVRPDSGVRKAAAEALGCPCVEMLSVPPGVSGMRIRRALADYLESVGVEFFENARIVRAEVREGVCSGLAVMACGREIMHQAKAVVAATGGIISGGVTLLPGKAKESIFGLDIPVPENVDQWTEPGIFGRHLVTSLGVRVDAGMRALGNTGSPFFSNVFFAGRVLGGYDYAAEKSGNGVAVASGWKAGLMAADLVAGESKASGAGI